MTLVPHPFWSVFTDPQADATRITVAVDVDAFMAAESSFWRRYDADVVRATPAPLVTHPPHDRFESCCRICGRPSVDPSPLLVPNARLVTVVRVDGDRVSWDPEFRPWVHRGCVGAR